MRRVEVVKGDITEVEVDAIVNPSNSYGLMGGGVALAIKRKGGEEIEREAMARAPIPVGCAAVTTAGRLRAKAVIHASTMREPAQRCSTEDVRRATKAALECALEHGFRSLAFPGMGTGVGGVPPQEAAMAMAEVLQAHLSQWSLPERVVLVAFDDELMEAFRRAVSRVQVDER